MIYTHQNFYPQSQYDIYFSFSKTKRRTLILSICIKYCGCDSVSSSDSGEYSFSSGKTLSWGEA